MTHKARGLGGATMKARTHFAIIVTFVALAIALPALAYDYPLSPEAIRDAYFPDMTCRMAPSFPAASMAWKISRMA